jgi:hypothetical protein
MSLDDDSQANIIPFPNTKSGGGEFFVVGRRAFAEACKLGLNPAVAYLTIARGSGSRPKSLWSVDAIERYTGISRPKAKFAIMTLTDAGLLTLERGGTRPLYGIVAAHLLPTLTLSDDDRIVLGQIEQGKSVHISRKQLETAKDLARRGFLISDGDDRRYYGSGSYFSKTVSGEHFSAEPQHVWLPNAIVDGAADETPPLALLRQMQDVRRLQLFVSLYDSHDLPNDGGVSRSFLYEKHLTSKVSQRGASTIWGFAEAETRHSLDPSPLPKPFLTGKRKENGGSDMGFDDFWDALSALEACGLLIFIPHVFESDKPEAEMLHAYPTKDGGCDPWERGVAIAAHAAGLVCLAAGEQEWTVQQARHLLPVPSHITNLAVIGIARLRYRPQTRMTAAWFARSKERSDAWKPIYEQIVQREKEAADNRAADRPA